MSGWGSVALALALLAVFGLAGLGTVRLLRPSALPVDAAAAAAPVVGVAVFSLIASAVVLRLPIDVALVAAIGVPLLLTFTETRRLAHARPRKYLLALLALAAIAVAAIGLASIPALSHHSGAAATWGNADPYLWVSQAKSLLSGPAPSPPTLFPDRIAYSHLTNDGWAPGLPALTALTAISVGRDPADVFGAVSAMLFALTPLATFAFARTALGWSPRLSVIAAAGVALNAYSLFSSFYGWQPQVTGVACVLTLTVAFRLALASAHDWLRPITLAAVLTAGALGIYRLPFLPYLLLATLAAATGYLVTARAQGRAALRRVMSRGGSLVIVSVALATPSLVGFIRGAKTFWTHNAAIASWSHYSRALPSEAIGLLPRAPNLDTAIGGDSFRLLAEALALVLIVRGLAHLRRQDGDHPDLLVALTIAVLAAWALMQLPLFTPYWSIKIMAYGAVPLVLAVLAPLHGRRFPPKTLIGAAIMMLASTAAVANAGRSTQDASTFQPLAAAVDQLPPREIVSINYSSTWKQMWAIYFTRNHPTSIPHASDYLVSSRHSAHSFVHPARLNVTSLMPGEILAARSPDRSDNHTSTSPTR